MELNFFHYLNLYIPICAWRCSRCENAKAKYGEFSGALTTVLMKLCGKCSDGNRAGIRGTSPIHDKEWWW